MFVNLLINKNVYIYIRNVFLSKKPEESAGVAFMYYCVFRFQMLFIDKNVYIHKNDVFHLFRFPMAVDHLNSLYIDIDVLSEGHIFYNTM